MASGMETPILDGSRHAAKIGFEDVVSFLVRRGTDNSLDDVENEQLNVLEIVVGHLIDEHVKDDTLYKSDVDFTIVDYYKKLAYSRCIKRERGESEIIWQNEERRKEIVAITVVSLAVVSLPSCLFRRLPPLIPI
ncbi:uncharacterized protein E5676_scaffold392G00330 [Cucumis melo var. makuwa]|uniref:Uncharacterized protein n=1 Tax=Cucumis melo var. makuwa TaxID=1194695 RepID=A0A5D3DCQ8_CUCMM|nr:uncharacterized protein E6C27_scaffold238G001160 [Cucumis melo var. makuwa]TYK21069.1 uncharacterized protein E5676_scaffold392G00330 [Cucumis melo var. makuwa]